MFPICLISSAMHLAKILWDKLIKTVIYLNNQSLDINDITLYKLDNHTCPNFNHLKVIRSSTSVHIPIEKKSEARYTLLIRNFY